MSTLGINVSNDPSDGSVDIAKIVPLLDNETLNPVYASS